MEQVADTVVDKMNQSIAEIAATTESLLGTTVLLSIGREFGEGKVLSLTAAGASGYHQELLVLLHTDNAYRGAEPFPKLTLEHLILANPDVIIDMVNSKDAEAVGVDQIKADWLAHPELKAVRNGRVYVLVGDQHFVPGPRFIETLEWLAEHLLERSDSE